MKIGERLFMYFFISLGLLVVGFIIMPLIFVYLTTNYLIVLKCLFMNEVLSAFFVTFLAASFSTLILLLLGIPLAYILARRDFKGKNIIESIIDLPLAIPHVIVGIILLITYGSSYSVIGKFLQSIGITIEDSFWGIVFAMTYVSAPLLINTIKEGIKSIDPMMENISRCLGAGPFMTFIKVVLPLTARYIVTGALLSWARAVSEVGSILILAYYPKTVNVLIIEWFHSYSIEYSKALTVLLLSLCLIIFMLLRLGGKRK